MLLTRKSSVLGYFTYLVYLFRVVESQQFYYEDYPVQRLGQQQFVSRNFETHFVLHQQQPQQQQRQQLSPIIYQYPDQQSQNSNIQPQYTREQQTYLQPIRYESQKSYFQPRNEYQQQLVHIQRQQQQPQQVRQQDGLLQQRIYYGQQQQQQPQPISQQNYQISETQKQQQQFVQPHSFIQQQQQQIRPVYEQQQQQILPINQKQEQFDQTQQLYYQPANVVQQKLQYTPGNMLPAASTAVKSAPKPSSATIGSLAYSDPAFEDDTSILNLNNTNGTMTCINCCQPMENPCKSCCDTRPLLFAKTLKTAVG